MIVELNEKTERDPVQENSGRCRIGHYRSFPELWYDDSGQRARSWRILRMPATDSTFADTITVTRSIDCLLSGRDPYVVRSFDPWHRVYIYRPSGLI